MPDNKTVITADENDILMFADKIRQNKQEQSLFAANLHNVVKNNVRINKPLTIGVTPNSLVIWPRWMENQINNSEFVLVVCSKSYYEKCYSDDKKSKGISWEVNIVYQHLYDGTSINTKFIPVFSKKRMNSLF